MIDLTNPKVRILLGVFLVFETLLMIACIDDDNPIGMFIAVNLFFVCTILFFWAIWLIISGIYMI